MSTNSQTSSAEFTLDKSKTALVVIDLQKGIIEMPAAPHNTSTVVKNASKIADIFRKNGMPVFLVHVMGTDKDSLHANSDEGWSTRGARPKDWADIVPELGPQAQDIVITKKQWGAFYGTDLDLQLRRRGIDTIVLCGISTNYGVESTARFAYEFGYQQIFAEDAMASRSAEMHSASVNYVLKRIGHVRSTEQVLRALEK